MDAVAKNKHGGQSPMTRWRDGTLGLLFVQQAQRRVFQALGGMFADLVR